MSSIYSSNVNVASRQAYNGPATSAASSIPAGTFVPGTKVQVGSHRVVIERYLAEGGYAHVYLVRLPKAVNGNDKAVLKRVAVPDREVLASMRTEVETMEKLKGHRHIVTYFDSHVSKLKGDGYEVFLLMEYCNGGGLIDFMNTRLQKRLTEPEILKIISDIAQGVACMHYLKPPLLHRDLKVENVLISSSSSGTRYKLCDFGSTASPRPAATNAMEGRLIEDDVQKHTTLQYRSPEMVDVYRKHPIDEKSDIWALGVLLYKLCYYITPFEEQGQMAILNASFKFPGYPSFSDRLKKLIASMLRENPQLRPTIYQVVHELCLMRGVDIPIQDIYAGRTQSETRRNQHLPTPETSTLLPPAVGAHTVPMVEKKQNIPEVAPMRRGRPVQNNFGHTTPRPSRSPVIRATSDPFAALDSTQPSLDQPATDEITKRFPPLDEFSLLHEPGGNFAFDQKPNTVRGHSRDINRRVTEVLADDAFAQPASTNKALPIQVKPASRGTATEKVSKLERAEPSQNISRQPSPFQERPKMVSTGTMTSPVSPPTHIRERPVTARPIYRFPPSEHRSTSQPRSSDTLRGTSVTIQPEGPGLKRTKFLDYNSKSQTTLLTGPTSTASSRPSLELQRPPQIDMDNTLSRSKSASSRSRPSNSYVRSNIAFLRQKAIGGDAKASNALDSSSSHRSMPSAGKEDLQREAEITKISSNVEFLRAMEGEDSLSRKRSTSSSRHIKRSSMPSISLSGTKSLLAGRFGEAFRRFETGTNGSHERVLNPSPDRGLTELTPIAGSEATDGRSDDGHVVDELDEVSPEVRRELERRRLSQEERRVAEGAAAYRQRTAANGEPRRIRASKGDCSRATSIQSKVQSLLSENGRASPTKTTDSYSRYTSPQPQGSQQTRSTILAAYEPNQDRPLPPEPHHRVSQKPEPSVIIPISKARPSISASAPLAQGPFPRPNTRPKPQTLRPGMREDRPPPSPAKPSSLAGKSVQSSVDGAALKDENWEANFSKRYPSLSGLEMVETEIDKARPPATRIRDV